MATLKLQARSIIAEDQQIGTGKEVRKGFTINPMKNLYGYSVVLSNTDGSVLINFSKSISNAISRSLEGVTDKAVSQAVVIKAFDEAMVIETQATHPAEDGERVGKPKFDKDGNPVMRTLAISQGGNGLSEAAANAVIAKAPEFSLKGAMSSRV